MLGYLFDLARVYAWLSVCVDAKPNKIKCVVACFVVRFTRRFKHVWISCPQIANMCVYVCMYVCMCVGMYVCIHLCMYACMYVCMYVKCASNVDRFLKPRMCMYVCSMYGKCAALVLVMQ